MLRTTRAQGRHHTTVRPRIIDALAVVLSAAFLVIGVMIAIGPGEGSGDEAPPPVPEVSTKAPASVTVTR